MLRGGPVSTARITKALHPAATAAERANSWVRKPLSSSCQILSGTHLPSLKTSDETHFDLESVLLTGVYFKPKRKAQTPTHNPCSLDRLQSVTGPLPCDKTNSPKLHPTYLYKWPMNWMFPNILCRPLSSSCAALCSASFRAFFSANSCSLVLGAVDSLSVLAGGEAGISPSS